MRAVVINEHGPAENLHLVDDLPIPEPGLGQIRLRVRAAALNRLDIWVRNGWPGIKLPLPHVLGADAAGDVDALGLGVSGWAIGDRAVLNPMITPEGGEIEFGGRENQAPGAGIVGENSSGTYTEYFIAPARNLLKLPAHVSYNEAAAASLVYLTAWHSLITRGGLRPGETVAIIGAGGGVNSASIQIAKYAGARVIVVGSNAEKLQRARELGADDLVDRSAEDWTRAIYKLTDKRGADIIVDNVGRETLPGSMRAVARGGRILIVGNTSGPHVELDIRYIFGKHISIIGSTMASQRDFIAVMRLIFDGKLKPIIGQVFPLAEAVEAHRLLERGDVFGKIVLEI